jgi:hypothetical protein
MGGKMINTIVHIQEEIFMKKLSWIMVGNVGIGERTIAKKVTSNAVKKSTVLITYLLSGALSCNASIFVPTRLTTVLNCFKNSTNNNIPEACMITQIIEDYVCSDSCLEANSKTYRAYTDNPYSCNSSVILCDRRNGKEVKNFSAKYVQAITISPKEDIILVIHKESITPGSTNSLALTAFAINNTASATDWISGQKWRIWQTPQLSQVNPLLPLTQEKFYSDPVQFWPDISRKVIKQLSIKSVVSPASSSKTDHIVVELYDTVRFPQCEARYASSKFTNKLIDPIFMGMARLIIKQKVLAARRQACELSQKDEPWAKACTFKMNF